MTKDTERKDETSQVLIPRKPYRAPQIIEYGHISKLTAGTSGTHTDKGTLSNVHGGG